MNDIICDVNIWYNIASGNIKEQDIDKLNLIGTAVNIIELANSSYLVNEPEYLKSVIFSFTNYHHHIYVSSPFDHIMAIFDKDFIPNDCASLELLNGFSIFMEIECFDDLPENDWLKIKELIEKKKHDKNYIAEIINSVLIHAQNEIRSKHIKKAYPQFCHKDSWKRFFIMIISAYSKKYYKKEFIIKFDDKRWEFLDFFLTAWSEYFKKLDVHFGSKFHDNDIHDLFNLVYVQPDKKYWTYETRSWAKVIVNDTSINTMLFQLDNCKNET
jgi:hypothetical protein